MKCSKIFNHKFVLGSCNLVFLACGVTLLASGFLLITDNPRILLSRLLGATSDRLSELSQPLFYYIALGLTGAGLIAVCAAMIGCWAFCVNTYCVLTLYFLIVLILLIGEFGICLMITLWPQCLGLNLDETEMVKALQGNYGVPGSEQFTAAMDLAQTRFQCCAMNNNINYDTSLWRLQSLGHKDLAVPLTCCYLDNLSKSDSYLDPKPTNLTLCQSLQKHEYQKSRHLDGCLDKIEFWYRQQYGLFLGAGLVIAIVEFCVLLSIILSCTKAAKKKESNTSESTKSLQSESNDNNDYNSQLSPSQIGPIPDLRPVYVQPPDLYKQKHVTTFKPPGTDYRLSRSYLV